MGGHTAKSHRGMSERNARKITRRMERTTDRAVHRLAKAIYAKMKQGTLDALMQDTFKTMRRRMTAAERESLIDA